MRAPVADGHRQAAAEEIWNWARAAGAVELMMISSCASHVKVDADFAVGTDLRYVRICGGNALATGELDLGPDVLPLSRDMPDGRSETDVSEGCDVIAVRQLRGGGLARPLLLVAAAASGKLCED